jgi:hypothetical protein
MKSDLYLRRICGPGVCALFALVGLCPSVSAAPVLGGGKALKSRTFTADVAPIIFQNCVSCHRPGEAAPFPLMKYEDVRKRGRQIAEVTEAKFMPPWHAEQGHVEFLNPRVLSAPQIAVLREWFEQGMPEGDPARLPPLPAFTEGWQLGKPDVILKMDRPFRIYAEGRDIYRNFVFPLDFTEDKWVKAIEFRPSARSAVHHALFFIDVSGAARKLDGEDGEPGFKGTGRAARTFTPVGGWALGSNVRALPDGLAYAYPKGADLVVQTHFHPSGKEEEETSTIGLHLAHEPPREMFVGVQLPAVFGEFSGVDIPAGATNYALKSSFTLPVDVEAFAISAHAHYLGKVMSLKATFPDGRSSLLLKIPDWDFAWQEQYTFKDRQRLPKGTKLDVEMCYDNSASNPKNPSSPPVRVKWGVRSTDEMGSITVQVIPRNKEDALALREALRDQMADLLIDRGSESAKPGPIVQALLKQFDKNENGRIDNDERPPLRAFMRASPLFPAQLNNSF